MEQETKDIEIKINIKMLFVFATILLAMLTIFYFAFSNKIEKTINSRYELDTPVFDENVNQSDTEYILKEYNGKIGIFENGSLIYTLDTYVFTLPENDKKLLTEGICVSTQEELFELLEYYY